MKTAMMEERIINVRHFQLDHAFAKYGKSLGIQITPSTIPIWNVKGLKVYFIVFGTLSTFRKHLVRTIMLGVVRGRRLAALSYSIHLSGFSRPLIRRFTTDSMFCFLLGSSNESGWIKTLVARYTDFSA